MTAKKKSPEQILADELAHLSLAQEANVRARRARDDSIMRARAAGATFDEIGAVIGTTKQAARTLVERIGR
jgi:hypothetical protein